MIKSHISASVEELTCEITAVMEHPEGKQGEGGAKNQLGRGGNQEFASGTKKKGKKQVFLILYPQHHRHVTPELTTTATAAPVQVTSN